MLYVGIAYFSAFLAAFWFIYGTNNCLGLFWTPLIADIIATFVIWLFSRTFNNSSFYDPYWSIVPPILALYWLATSSSPYNVTVPAGRTIL